MGQNENAYLHIFATEIHNSKYPMTIAINNINITLKET